MHLGPSRRRRGRPGRADPPRPGRAAAAFGRLRYRIWQVLPFWSRRWIAPSVIGFCLINSFTFSVDLVLLWLGFGVLHLPYPVAVSVAYGTALTLAFVLNRQLNFRVHAPVGWQVVRYVGAVVVNYLAFILALNTALHGAGVPYPGARIVAGLCEAVFLYSALRWFVFVPVRPGATRKAGRVA